MEAKGYDYVPIKLYLQNQKETGKTSGLYQPA
jgi:hypothetical protein